MMRFILFAVIAAFILAILISHRIYIYEYFGRFLFRKEKKKRYDIKQKYKNRKL